MPAARRADSLDRLRSDSRRSLQLAREEARQLGHGFLGVAHVLLGLAAEGGTAAQVVTEFAVNPQHVRRRLVVLEGSGKPIPHGRPGATGECRRALEYAIEEAVRLGHDFAGTGHVLAGLVREGSVHRVLPTVDLGRLGSRALDAEIAHTSQPAVHPTDYLRPLAADARARVERAVRRGAPDLRVQFVEAIRGVAHTEAEEIALGELVTAWDRATRDFHVHLSALDPDDIAAMSIAELEEALAQFLKPALAPVESLLTRHLPR